MTIVRSMPGCSLAPPPLRQTAFGLMLEVVAPLTKPARSRYPAGPEGDALMLAHLDEVGERIRAAERNAKSSIPRVPGKTPASMTLTIRSVKYRYMDLKTVGCAGCRRTLLGPSQEHLRAAAGPTTRKRLPPPVAGRINDRPVCERCLIERAAVA